MLGVRRRLPQNGSASVRSHFGHSSRSQHPAEQPLLIFGHASSSAGCQCFDASSSSAGRPCCDDSSSSAGRQCFDASSSSAGRRSEPLPSPPSRTRCPAVGSLCPVDGSQARRDDGGARVAADDVLPLHHAKRGAAAASGLADHPRETRTPGGARTCAAAAKGLDAITPGGALALTLRHDRALLVILPRGSEGGAAAESSEDS